MGIFGGGDGTRDDYLKLETRVARLEEQVARLAAALNGVSGAATAVPAEVASAAGAVPIWEQEARALKADGKAINAIKVVRQATGWGLKQAKDYVDRL